MKRRDSASPSQTATKSLTTVIENAIDRRLIVGIKASAASGSATYVSPPRSAIVVG